MPGPYPPEVQLCEVALKVYQSEDLSLKIQALGEIIKLAYGLLATIADPYRILPASTDQDHQSNNLQETGRQIPGGTTIHDLPDEILSHIFRHIHGEERVTTFPSLALVSRRWYTVILQDPYLWNEIVVKPNGRLENIKAWHHHVNRCIQRSATCPLDIKVDFSEVKPVSAHANNSLKILFTKTDLEDYEKELEYWNFEDLCTDLTETYFNYYIDILRLLSGMPTVKDLLEENPKVVAAKKKSKKPARKGKPKAPKVELDSSMTRWRSFHIILPASWPNDTVERLWATPNKPTPHLKHLQIEIEGERPDGTYEDDVLYKVAFPAVDALEEFTCNFPIELDSMERLHTRVRDLRIVVDQLTFGELNKFVNLVRLELTHMSKKPNAESDFPTDRVHLPKLTHLTLCGNVAQFIPILLTAPALEYLSLLYYGLVEISDKISLYSTVKRLDWRVGDWSQEKEYKRVPISQDGYPDVDLRSIERLLTQCTSLEELRVWENRADPWGQAFMKRVLPFIPQGEPLSRLKRVAFHLAIDWTEEFDRSQITCSYDIEAARSRLPDTKLVPTYLK